MKKHLHFEKPEEILQFIYTAPTDYVIYLSADSSNALFSFFKKFDADQKIVGYSSIVVTLKNCKILPRIHLLICVEYDKNYYKVSQMNSKIFTDKSKNVFYIDHQ